MVLRSGKTGAGSGRLFDCGNGRNVHRGAKGSERPYSFLLYRAPDVPESITANEPVPATAVDHHGGPQPSKVTLSLQPLRPEHHPAISCRWIGRTRNTVSVYRNSRARRGSCSILPLPSFPVPLVRTKRVWPCPCGR